MQLFVAHSTELGLQRNGLEGLGGGGAEASEREAPPSSPETAPGRARVQ